MSNPSRQSIDDATCKTLIEELVGLQSVSGDESRASRFLVGKFESMGYDQAYVDSVGNAVGIRGEKNAPVTLMLLGHIDTVPGNIPVRIEDDLLYGRGSVDAKGPLATFALAAAMTEIPASVKLVVVGAVEEESATSKGARQISRDFSADYCVIGEPSGATAITLGYKGRVLIDYQVEVNMGHSAGPDRGAAEFASEFWQRILHECQEFNSGHTKLFDQMLPSLRSINSQTDGLVSTATCKTGIRLPMGFDIDRFETRLSEIAESGTAHSYGYEPAWRSDRSNELCRALATAIRSVGVKPTYKLKTGTADMNVVGPVWNCPILAYGPGDSSLDHTPNEHLNLTEFVQAIHILTEALNLLCSRL